VILKQKASEILQDLATKKNTTDLTRKSEYVFPARQRTKKRPYLFDLRKTLNRICVLAVIENFSIHCLKHTYATWSLASGAPLATL